MLLYVKKCSIICTLWCIYNIFVAVFFQNVITITKLIECCSSCLISYKSDCFCSNKVVVIDLAHNHYDLLIIRHAAHSTPVHRIDRIIIDNQFVIASTSQKGTYSYYTLNGGDWRREPSWWVPVSRRLTRHGDDKILHLFADDDRLFITLFYNIRQYCCGVSY